MSDFQIKNGVLEKYTGAGGDVIIPQDVISIGWRAFYCCGKLTSIVIPSSVTSIESSAFELCGKLTSVVIPASVRSIRRCAFNYCNSLTSVTISEGVRSIEDHAFSDCSKLKSVILPNSLEKIGDGAFHSCKGLESVTIPKGVIMGDDVFAGSNRCLHIIIHREKPIQSNDELGLLLPGFQAGTYYITVMIEDKPSQRMTISRCWRKTISPVTQEDCKEYDQLLRYGVLGNDERINEDGRILGILLRLQNTECPVKSDFKGEYFDFLVEKSNKAIKLAIAEHDPIMIQTLCTAGVITGENSKAIQKKLTATQIPELIETAGNLDTYIASAKASIPTESNQLSPLEKECSEWMKNNKGEKTLLSLKIENINPVKKKDSEELAPVLLTRFVIAALLQFSDSSDRTKRQEILERVDAIAEDLDRDSLVSAIMNIYDHCSSRNQQVKVCSALFRFADGELIQKVYNAFKKSYYEEQVLHAVMLSDTREAMLIADKNNYLRQYADLRGKTADDFRDTVLSNVGLDEYGTKTYNLGNQTVIARMGSDLSFVIELPGGKTSKSMPKKGSDPELYEKANTDFSEIKKASKKIIKNRIANLFEEFQSGKGRDGAGWKTAYLKNPLLRHVASLLVWKQKDKLFTLMDKEAIDWKGDAVNLSDDKIIIAHPMEMAENEIKAWQNYFLQKKLKQPFAQVWEPVYDSKEIEPNRYEGCMIPYYRFMDQKKNGIEIFDVDFHNEIHISFKDCIANVERVDFERHSISPDHRFEVKNFKFYEYTRQVNHIVAYLDRVTVWERIRKDDVSVEKQLTSFTLAQIIEFIKAATDAKANNVLALLLQYRNEKYPDYNIDDGLTLDW